jgi:hypothetical protein
MTLEQKVARLKLVADGLRRIQEFESARYLDEYAAHLAQPAQAVDVGLIAECAEALRRTAPVRPDLNTIADKLTRALSGEAWPVGDDTRRLQFVLDHVPHSVLADFGVLPPMWDLPEGEAHIDDARRTIDAVLAAGG